MRGSRAMISPVSTPRALVSSALRVSASSTTHTLVRKSGRTARSSSSVTWMELGVRQTVPVKTFPSRVYTRTFSVTQ